MFSISKTELAKRYFWRALVNIAEPEQAKIPDGLLHPHHGFHTLPDGTLAPRHHGHDHRPKRTSSLGTTIYPFALLKVGTVKAMI